MADSVDPDQMPLFVASDLGLHCLLRPVCPNIKGNYGIQLLHYMCALRKNNWNSSSTLFDGPFWAEVIITDTEVKKREESPSFVLNP